MGINGEKTEDDRCKKSFTNRRQIEQREKWVFILGVLVVVIEYSMVLFGLKYREWFA